MLRIQFQQPTYHNIVGKLFRRSSKLFIVEYLKFRMLHVSTAMQFVLLQYSRFIYRWIKTTIASLYSTFLFARSFN